MSAWMIIQVTCVNAFLMTVYCSYKRNNVNILFEHAHLAAPFELTRIVVKVVC
jgi:hypothetical protein